ncbi:major facilitator superfamily domain-containing protein [Microdochium bolleyi]|uniref:Major facilitator superfamily domain-containing protein n=1 Tax=Microdochium bolleyi TaxID=196109 RepID=A0A136IK14_9PEZI|nr:major facilitator superfamily domain-containing protein [Microdochium bolleyi]
MAFGILEPTTTGQSGIIPGTTLLKGPDPRSHDDNAGDTVDKPIMHLSRVRQELYFAMLLFGACLTGVIGPVLVPGFLLVAADLGTTLLNVTLLNGTLIMALGVGSYVLAVLARVVGRRLVFMITTLVLIASCVWAALSPSYGSLLGSRVAQGLSMAAFFSVGGTTSITDVFHVRERGRRSGSWNFAVLCSVNIAPIISGYVITTLGWRWCFWILAISFGVSLAAVWFLYPEPCHGSVGMVHHSDMVIDGHCGADSRPFTPNRKIWRRLLGVQHIRFGTFGDVWRGLVEPLALLWHPAAIWSCVLWSIIFTWVIVLGAVAAQIFSAPPYLMPATEIGVLVGVAPLIGSAIGTVFAGWFSDKAASVLSARNGGVFEAEFRLLTMIPCLVGVVVGAYGLGRAIGDGLSPLVCGVFLVILNVGVGAGCTGIVAYTNDVFNAKSGEVFGLAMLIKSAFAFGLTFMLNDFYAQQGPVIFFSTWGGLSTFGCLVTIPMYVYGKRARARMGAQAE